LSKEDPKQPISAYYASVNWNKTVLWLDLQQTEAQAQIHQLLPQMDLVIANYKPGSAEKLGMGYAQLAALNPRLIYANLTGFGGQDDRAAFDVVLQAESGFMFMNGQADGPPTKMPVALIDVLAAHQMKEGILWALYQRSLTGKGGYVEVSLLESALAALANQATNWLMNGHVPQRMGSLHPNIAPYGECVRTADGLDLVLAIGSDAQFRALCKRLGQEAWADDPRFVNNQQRILHRQALHELLLAAFAQWPAQPLLQDCHAAHIPIGQIRDMRQVFDLAQAQEMILREQHSDGFTSARLATKAFAYRAYEGG
jgi:crotonobetainyl-CoA:carnitine CoA-transferase CaiB-like acyl-CoA transferase